VELSHRLEKKYELHHQEGKRLEKTHKEKLHGKDKAKYEIYEAVQKELPKSKSLEDLQAKLENHGIKAVIKDQGLTLGKGLQYFKASAVDTNFGLKNMLKTIENIVTKALEKTIPGLKAIKLIKGIAEKGIDKGHGHELEL
jgi:phosphoribosylamine-glycine ligase